MQNSTYSLLYYKMNVSPALNLKGSSFKKLNFKLIIHHSGLFSTLSLAIILGEQTSLFLDKNPNIPSVYISYLLQETPCGCRYSELLLSNLLLFSMTFPPSYIYLTR